VASGNNARFTKNGARTVANCWVQYAQAPANGTPTIAYRRGAYTLANISVVDADLRAQC
jgi:hypothetical protein